MPWQFDISQETLLLFFQLLSKLFFSFWRAKIFKCAHQVFTQRFEDEKWTPSDLSENHLNGLIQLFFILKQNGLEVVSMDVLGGGERA